MIRWMMDRMPWNYRPAERGFWVSLCCLLMALRVGAAIVDEGPFQLTDENGATQARITTEGLLNIREIAPVTSAQDLTFSDVDGTARAGFSRDQGTLFFLNTDNVSTGSFAAGGLDNSNTVTFGTVEPDANYYILLASEGDGDNLSITTKQVTDFIVTNNSTHTNEINYFWMKVRAAAPNGTP